MNQTKTISNQTHTDAELFPSSFILRPARTRKYIRAFSGRWYTRTAWRGISVGKDLKVEASERFRFMVSQRPCMFGVFFYSHRKRWIFLKVFRLFYMYFTLKRLRVENSCFLWIYISTAVIFGSKITEYQNTKHSKHLEMKLDNAIYDYNYILLQCALIMEFSSF